MADKTKTVPVTVIKRLGSQTAKFDLPVTISKLDGTTAQITLHCKALRKTEWAALKDAHQRASIEAVTEMVAPPAPTPAPAPAVPAKRVRKGNAAKAGLDALAAQPGTATAAPPESVADMVTAMILERGYETTVRKGIKSDADTVLQFAHGWDLEDPFTPDTLQQLEDEFGGALRASLNAYDIAIFQGRLGNSAP